MPPGPTCSCTVSMISESCTTFFHCERTKFTSSRSEANVLCSSATWTPNVCKLSSAADTVAPCSVRSVCPAWARLFTRIVVSSLRIATPTSSKTQRSNATPRLTRSPNLMRRTVISVSPLRRSSVSSTDRGAEMEVPEAALEASLPPPPNTLTASAPSAGGASFAASVWTVSCCSASTVGTVSTLTRRVELGAPSKSDAASPERAGFSPLTCVTLCGISVSSFAMPPHAGSAPGSALLELAMLSAAACCGDGDSARGLNATPRLASRAVPELGSKGKRGLSSCSLSSAESCPAMLSWSSWVPIEPWLCCKGPLFVSCTSPPPLILDQLASTSGPCSVACRAALPGNASTCSCSWASLPFGNDTLWVSLCKCARKWPQLNLGCASERE